MALKINPTAKIKRHYILIEGKKEDIEKAILEGVGVIGWANAGPLFVGEKDGKVILSVNRKEVDSVRACFELFNGKAKIIRVSGTIRGLGK